MLSSDVFVFLDSAQYSKSLRYSTKDGAKRGTSYQSDTPIKLPNGLYLLTVPIKHNGYFPLNKAYIDYTHNWAQRHYAVLKSAYLKAPNYPKILEQINNILSIKFESLAHLNILTALWALTHILGISSDISELKIETINNYLAENKTVRLEKIYLGSNLGVARPDGKQKGTEWTTAICKKIGGTEYIHGQTAADNYMDLTYYKLNGITPIPQQWICKEYPQLFNKIPFLPNLSIIDLLFNTNDQKAKALLIS